MTASHGTFPQNDDRFYVVGMVGDDMLLGGANDGNSLTGMFNGSILAGGGLTSQSGNTTSAAGVFGQRSKSNNSMSNVNNNQI